MKNTQNINSDNLESLFDDVLRNLPNSDWTWCISEYLQVKPGQKRYVAWLETDSNIRGGIQLTGERDGSMRRVLSMEGHCLLEKETSLDLITHLER